MSARNIILPDYRLILSVTSAIERGIVLTLSQGLFDLYNLLSLDGVGREVGEESAVALTGSLQLFIASLLLQLLYFVNLGE